MGFIKGRREHQIAVAVMCIAVLIVGFIFWKSHRKMELQKERDLFIILQKADADIVDNIKMIKLNPPADKVCVNREDKRMVIDSLKILESKLLSKTKEIDNALIKNSNRYDIYITSDNLHLVAPIHMYKQAIVYNGYSYFFDTDTQKIFNEVYNVLSEPLTLEEFQKKYK